MSRNHHSRVAVVRSSGAITWVPGFLRTLALLVLCLLPIQLRAGAATPHAHTLLLLVLDASDGSLDHHSDGDEAVGTTHEHTDTSSEAMPTRPDIPTIENAIFTGGELAMLAAVLTALAIPPPHSERVWPCPACWSNYPSSA